MLAKCPTSLMSALNDDRSLDLGKSASYAKDKCLLTIQ